MKATNMLFSRTALILAVVALLTSSCVPSEVVESQIVGDSSEPQSSASLRVNGVDIPQPPENSQHGYLVEDNRIPSITNCTEWKDFWDGRGPAASFAIAAQYPELEGLEVSTQIYLKNMHLDPDQNGVVCYDDLGITEILPKNINDSSKRVSTETCKLKSDQLGAGFPRPSGFLPPDGTVSAVMLFVEFKDVKVTEDIQVEARSYYQEFTEFMKRQSGGRQTWEFVVPEMVFSIDKESKVYRADFSNPNFGNPDFRQYFQDAVRAADPYVDFSQFDVVYVIPPREIGSSISYGPSFPRLDSGYITSDEGSILAGATAGNDSRLGANSEPWVWLAHETGHLYGLQHPLNEKGLTDVFGRSSGPNGSLELWDLMTWMRTPSPDFWAWSRFWIGWLSDEQVYCTSMDSLTSGVQIHLMFSDREQVGEQISYVVIPLSETRAVALEARNLSREGRLLVQEIDVEKGEREGQIRVIPANQRTIEGWLDGSASVGEKLHYEGLVFEVIGETELGLIVEVKPGG